MKNLAIALAIITLTASAAHADATIEQKTQIHLGGALAVGNVFGGKATHEGIVNTTSIRGDRKSTRAGDSGEIVDLGEEKIYIVDYGRKTYTVKTFDQLRKEFEDAQKRSEQRATKENKGEAPEYEVDFDIKSTGVKETINGWNTHEEVVTITVHEKGKKIQQSGGFIMTSDLAMGPKIAAMNELASFERRFVQKVYGKGFATDMRSMMAAAAMTPAFAKAMKAFGEHSSSFNGSAIRTKMRFETVAGTEQKASGNDEREQPTSVSGAIFGGLANRMKKRNEEKEGTTSEPGHSEMMTSTTEILRATESAPADAVAIPAGFRQR